MKLSTSLCKMSIQAVKNGLKSIGQNVPSLAMGDVFGQGFPGESRVLHVAEVGTIGSIVVIDRRSKDKECRCATKIERCRRGA